MKIDRYLGMQLLVGTVLALAALLAILSVVDFMHEFRKTDAVYTLSAVVRYIGWTTASRAYDVLPNAVMIGSLLSLGNLAARSELIALRAAGYSVNRIIFSILGVSCIFVVLVFVIGEALIPPAEAAASRVRDEDSRPGTFQRTDVGIWAREGNYFIHADGIDESGAYRDISIYELGEGGRIRRILNGASLEVENRRFLLRDVREVLINREDIALQHFPSMVIDRVPQADGESFGAGDPETMSIGALIRQINFLRLSSLRHDSHELALWLKFSQPLSVLVMLLLTLPFVFSPVRSSAGQRLLYGILIGLAYTLVNKNSGSAAIVFGFPLVLGAFAPLLLGGTIGVYCLARLR